MPALFVWSCQDTAWKVDSISFIRGSPPPRPRSSASEPPRSCRPPEAGAGALGSPSWSGRWPDVILAHLLGGPLAFAKLLPQLVQDAPPGTYPRCGWTGTFIARARCRVSWAWEEVGGVVVAVAEGLGVLIQQEAWLPRGHLRQSHLQLHIINGLPAV